MARKKTVLVVVAHADDMEFMAAGTLALMVAKGYDVYEYILTDNAKGSFSLSPAELIAVSAREAVAAGELLGLKEVRLDSYPDGDLNETHPNVLRGKIMAMIREVRADIVMSWDPYAPYEDHPDHRITAMATREAAAFSAMPLFYPEHPHPPHMVTEAYWFAKSPWNAGKYVDITATIDKKIQALLLHECQMRMTVDALQREARAVGAEVPILADVEGDRYRMILEMGIRQFCAATGAAAGFEYAELFRYEKFGMLDSHFGGNYIQCDF